MRYFIFILILISCKKSSNTIEGSLGSSPPNPPDTTIRKHIAVIYFNPSYCYNGSLNLTWNKNIDSNFTVGSKSAVTYTKTFVSNYLNIRFSSNDTIQPLNKNCYTDLKVTIDNFVFVNLQKTYLTHTLVNIN